MATDKKSKLKNIASKGQSYSASKYARYGDFKESDVHQGKVTYRGSTLNDHPLTNRNQFATNVARSGGGAKAFIFQNKLYKFANQDRSGMSATHSESTA